METKLIDLQLIVKLRDTYIFDEEILSKHFAIKDINAYVTENRKMIQSQTDNLVIIDGANESNNLFDFNDILFSSGLKIKYLFDNYHRYNIFNQLHELHQKSAKVDTTSLTELPFPNFYNFFVIEFSKQTYEGNIDKMYEDVLMNYMAPLNRFVRGKNEFHSQESILDFLYLKGIPTEADGVGSAECFSQMSIPPYARTASNGQGVNIFDIESDWNVNNPELQNPLLVKQIFPAVGARVIGNTIHGTKVLEVLSAKVDNLNDIDGIVPSAHIFLSSTMSKVGSNPMIYSEENALLSALYRQEQDSTIQIEKGSIVLLEVYLPPFPIEIQPAMWLLIKLATSTLGVIVIEAAGNKSNNLSVFQPPQAIGLPIADALKQRYKILLDKLRAGNFATQFIGSLTFDSDFRESNYLHEFFINNDSGAILVGSYVKVEPIFYKLPTSNYDSRSINLSKVKVYGLGSGIKTTISDFGETSAASAMIAGVAAYLQQYAYSKLKYISAPEMLRLLTLPTNTDVYLKPNRQVTIGKIPNVVKAIEQINLNYIGYPNK